MVFWQLAVLSHGAMPILSMVFCPFSFLSIKNDLATAI